MALLALKSSIVCVCVCSCSSRCAEKYSPAIGSVIPLSCHEHIVVTGLTLSDPCLLKIAVTVAVCRSESCEWQKK